MLIQNDKYTSIAIHPGELLIYDTSLENDVKSLRTFIGISILSCSTFFCGPLLAQLEDQSIADQKQINPEKLHPFKLNLAADYAAETKLEKSGFHGQRLTYGQSNATLEGTFYYNPCLVEGAIALAGYSHTLLDWKCNPYFNQKNFDTLTLGFKAFSGRCSKWFWQAYLATNLDLDHQNYNYYATYDMLLWGRYNLCFGDEDLGFHVGFIGQTGMRVDRVYPILGIDWQYSPKWKFNAVFPLNVSAVYSYDCFWKMGVGGRFFDTRHRTGKDQPLPMAIICYRTIGAEAFIAFTDCDWLEANLHAGYIVCGKVKISNRQQEDGKWFEVDPSPYVGAEVNLKY